MHALAGVEVPQRLARLRVHSFEGLRIIAKKDKAARGGHRSTRGMPRTHLGKSPRRFVGFEIVGEQNLLPLIAWAVPRSRRVIGLSFGKLLRLQKEEIAVFLRQEIEKVSRGIVRRRVPVGSSGESGAGPHALCRGLHAGSNRPALRVDSLCPIQFFYERKSRQKSSARAVQHV